MGSEGFAPPVVATHDSSDSSAPLVVLFHGRGSSESDIIALAAELPPDLSYAAVRAPISEGGGYAWFANRGIGRPVADSLRSTMDWFHAWLEQAAPPERSVVLVGFSGGAAFAGGLALDKPDRYRGAAILYGTVPFDAGVPVESGRLDGMRVLVAQGDSDRVIPGELLENTWNFLLNDSGAQVTTYRDGGGHGISPGALAELREWLSGMITGDPGSRS